ncbi:Sugar/inositol transporter [Lasiodiplodia theobromae]|uniref:Sugar/inositol transporter n=1 Tax=Lasiodiplodia theobromae TaxID=45133 RepID=UPI0015C3D4FF|nr:Sugar/inositol transporter [Lasiodiplodia theobromae]KAF4541818.1 Sugar/inositol transporter [Lasiodiplodia theobromae]
MSDPLELRERITSSKRSSNDVESTLRDEDHIQVYIDNPLDNLTLEELEEQVAAFQLKYGLVHVIDEKLLQKGARVAQSGRTFEAIEELTQEELQALRDEHTRLFRQPPAFWITICCTCIAAVLQGWDQTGSNGANLEWPDAFDLVVDGDNPVESDVWILGVVNAAPYFAASMLGCWISDPLNNYTGRRGTIFFSAIFCFASVIGAAFTQNWIQLFFCRCLLGIGMGSKAATVPVYAAENSPAFFRGSFVMSWQLWVAFGIFLGFSANLAVYQVPIIGWRLQFGSAFIPAVPLLILIWWAPESPRWYIKQNCYPQAYHSLLRLRNVPLQAARDLYYMHVQIELENKMLAAEQAARSGGRAADEETVSRTPVARDLYKAKMYVRRFVQLFTIARVRRATLACTTVMLAQQMCGINIVIFYSATLFVEEAKADKQTALLVSWGFGLANFIFALPAVHRIDTLGRRTLLLVTFPGMALTLLAAGFSFYIPENNPARLDLITFWIFFFAVFYSPGEGPVPFTYSSEAFPLSHREVGMSWAVATNLFWAGILNTVFPKLTDALSNTGALGLFAGLNVVAFVMIFLWVPETKQRTLEELDSIFKEPTRHHMHYQITVTLPWLWKRYVLRQDVERAPLYVFRR